MAARRTYNNLFEAIKAQDERALAEMLKNGADPEATNEKRDTPLALAVALNDLPCVRDLAKGGLTPLARADACGHAAIAGYLRATFNRRNKADAVSTEAAPSPGLQQDITIRRPLEFKPRKGTTP